MVAANRESTFVRELDLLSHKLGIRTTCTSTYSIADKNELQLCESKFRVERNRDHGDECTGR